MTEVMGSVIASVLTLYVFATFVLGAVYSTIGGWRWDQFLTAGRQMGAMFLLLLCVIASLIGVWFLFFGAVRVIANLT